MGSRAQICSPLQQMQARSLAWGQQGAGALWPYRSHVLCPVCLVHARARRQPRQPLGRTPLNAAYSFRKLIAQSAQQWRHRGTR